MVVCPIAIAVGCRKCPAFGICPAKSLIGDYKPPDPDVTQPLPDPKKAAKRARKKR